MQLNQNWFLIEMILPIFSRTHFTEPLNLGDCEAEEFEIENRADQLIAINKAI